MKLSLFGRWAFALVAALALGLGMSACGGGTIAYLWAPGVQVGTGVGNVINGFKVDDFTGNLTEIPHAPFPSQGSNPAYLVVKPGGRYVYVLNQGATAPSATSCPVITNAATDPRSDPSANIALFSVGGDGILTFQQSYSTQGAIHTWATFDSTGTYLYVLDQCKVTVNQAGTSPTYSTDGTGSITAFSTDSTTGRLTLLQNTQSIPSGGNAPTFFNVGLQPNMMKASGSCLFTLNTGTQTVTPYLFGSGGQLTTVTTGDIKLNTAKATSINGNGSNIIITDASQNKIYPYVTGATCGLSQFSGGPVANETGAVNPMQSFIDASGQYIFVLNYTNSNTNTTASNSSISAWSIVAANQQLVPQTGAPYVTVGSGPNCMVEDPTAQYMYVSNYFDQTITGKLFDSTHGFLSDLTRGSSFPNTGKLTCLVLSGAVD